MKYRGCHGLWSLSNIVVDTTLKMMRRVVGQKYLQKDLKYGAREGWRRSVGPIV
jgi:hypothetical protein